MTAGTGRGRWQLVSLAGSFPTTIAATALIIATVTQASYSHALLFSGIFALLPALTALYFLRTGRISDIEVRDRDERHTLFILGLTYSLLGLGLLEHLAVAGPLLNLGIVQVVLVLIVFFINRSWKISVHTTTWGACITALYFTIGPASLLALPGAYLIGRSRLELDCHTPRQVVAGFVAGFALTALVFLR